MMIESSGRFRHVPRGLAAGMALALLGTQPALAQAPAYPHWREGRGAEVFPNVAPRTSGAQRLVRIGVAGHILPVTSCADGGPGSLREMVAVAEDHDSVDLRALSCSAITLSTGAINVPVDNLTLLGPGAQQLAVDGDGKDRVLFDRHGGELIVSGLTIRNGAAQVTGLGITGGACIADAGYLTLVDSVVSGCIASAEGVYGGAINAGVLTMQRSTLSGNTAYGNLPGTGTAASGAGAYAVYAYLTDSTVTGNVASHHADPANDGYDIGGGLMISRGGSVLRSTIDHNSATHRGGGIFSIGSLSVDNSTISANGSALGGGVFMRIPGVLTMTSATVSGNTASDGGGMVLSPNGGALQSTIVFGNGANDLSAAGAQVLGGDHDLVGAASSTLTLPTGTLHSDPHLLPLTMNGGPTRTQALPAGSVALDQGSNPSAASVDQRGAGYPRVIGAAADIGAYESAQAAPAVPVPNLSAWAVLLLALGLGGIAARRTRQRVGNAKTRRVAGFWINVSRGL